MIINKLKSLAVITAISIASFNITFAADCTDDATGAYSAMGGCSAVLVMMGGCATQAIIDECPVSCDACPGVCGDDIFSWDETGIVGGGPDGLTYCPEDIPGCDLVENTLSLRPDGALLYNSSASSGIYGFQLYVEGALITDVTGGDAGAYLGNVQFNECADCEAGVTSSVLLGFDTEGDFIPAGSCGTLAALALDGTVTGLNTGFDNAGQCTAGSCTQGSSIGTSCSSDSDCLGNPRLTISGDGGVDLGYTYPGFWDETLSTTKVPSPDVPDLFTLGNNYPNPFNPSTAISFDVPKTISGDISLKIYDLSGKEIITLASGSYLPGKYTVNWNAVNNFGEPVASGMYVYRYVSSEQAITRKMLYMK